jgi:hypothetical protein
MQPTEPRQKLQRLSVRYPNLLMMTVMMMTSKGRSLFPKAVSIMMESVTTRTKITVPRIVFHQAHQTTTSKKYRGLSERVLVLPLLLRKDGKQPRLIDTTTNPNSFLRRRCCFQTTENCSSCHSGCHTDFKCLCHHCC